MSGAIPSYTCTPFTCLPGVDKENFIFTVLFSVCMENVFKFIWYSRSIHLCTVTLTALTITGTGSIQRSVAE
jgi:hypothetical protein